MVQFEPERELGAQARGGKEKGTRLVVGEARPTAILAEPGTGKSLVPKHSYRYPRSFAGPISSLCRWLRGGKKTFMELACLAPEIKPGLQRVIEDWDRLGPSHRIRTSIDEICECKGVDPVDLIAVVAEAAARFRDNHCVLLTALCTPSIAEKVAETWNKRAEALNKSQEQTREKPDGLAEHPTEKTLLRRSFSAPISSICEMIRGGKETFMEWARLAPDIDSGTRRVIEEWDRLQPSYRKRISIDEICRLKGVDPIHFICVVGEAELRFFDNAQTLIAAVSAALSRERAG